MNLLSALRRRIIKRPSKRTVAIGVAALCCFIGGAGTGDAYWNTGNQVAAGGSGTVPGESYQLCTAPGSYLTSPYSYDALGSGSASYTVAQYEALTGYGTTLPSLPAYISAQVSTTEAAIIYAPTMTSISPASYTLPGSPIVSFFEGGSYGAIGLSTVPGDEFVGGSASGYPEPVFAGGGGISSANGHFDFSGVGSSTVLGTLSASASVGATAISTSAMSYPVVPWEWLIIGIGGSNTDRLQVQSVSGTESGGYTLTLAPVAAGSGTGYSTGPVNIALSSGADIYYAGPASDVTIDYLTINGGAGDTTFSLQGSAGNIQASGWTIEHNDLGANYAGGASWATTNAAGQGIYGGDNSTVEYNCFEQQGEYAINAFGANVVFSYNQVDQTPYNPDLDGNGDTGCGKWWATTNSVTTDNAFTDEGYSVCVWYDNGNTGSLASGNYFYNIDSRAIQDETGYNADFTDNLFQDVDGAIYLNASGGWPISGSNYNNEFVISGNTFNNAYSGVSIWGASGRSCLNSGEAVGSESDPYCSGGYPQLPLTQQYFSHYVDSVLGTGTTTYGAQTCSTATPCGTSGNPLVLSGPISPADHLGVAGYNPDNSSPSPVIVTTSDTANVSTFTGSGTITSVSATSAFPSSGQLIADTSTGTLYTATGAVLSYTGTTGSTFTGVNLVSGSGTLSGNLEAVQPFAVTSVTCPGGNCTDNTDIQTSPTICGTSATCPGGSTSVTIAAGADIYTTGTCPYNATTTASPSGPTAANSITYYDGCMWEDRNVSVSGNTFEVNATTFNATSTSHGGSAWSCTTGVGNNCAQNAMGYQIGGEDALPYNTPVLANAMMSDSSLSSGLYLNNLNASGSPLVGGSTGITSNAETPYDDLWSTNTYAGTWSFQAYVQAAGCPVSWTGSALEWVGSGGNACAIDLAQWQTYWGQD
jgi:hypothetical protein